MSTQTTPDENAPDAATALRQALAQHQAGHVKRAMETYRRVLDVHPENADAWHLYGIATQQYGDLAGAEEMIRRADELRPGHAPYLSNLGSLYNERGERAAAEDALRRAVAANKTYAPAHINLGHLLRGADRPAEAVESYRRATQVAPQYASAWCHLARALDFVGETLEAIDAYGRLQELTAEVALEDRLKLGVLLQRVGKLDEARQIFTDVVGEEPTPTVHLNLGAVQKQLGDDSKAMESFRAAVAVDPNYALAHRHLGFALMHAGDAVGAEDSFRRAIALDPDDALVREQLALLWAEQDKYEDAASIALVPSRGRPGPDTADGAISAVKIRHDLGQLRYLRYRNLLSAELTPFLLEYERHAPAWLRGTAASLDALSPKPSSTFRSVYNRLLHIATAAPVPNAIDPNLDTAAATAAFHAQRHAVVDNVLSPSALAGLHGFCLESTVWTRMPFPGELSANIRDGFAPPVLFQIAAELRRALPDILGQHRLSHCWAYRYDGNSTGIEIHADDGAVSVNLWITPDEANRAPDAGGLLLWPTPVPSDYFAEPDHTKKLLILKDTLRETAAPATNVPYRCNRAVIFPSDTIHRTDDFDFGDSYAERRMNVTLMFGERA